jgi:4-oxalomesaconate tautomerase
MTTTDLRAGPVRCMLMRGGTSKGAYFLADDLPTDVAARNDLLLRIMGSPDTRQIDGLGGAHQLTSKVAVVSRSEDPDADVDYLFLQVNVDEPTVTGQQNCGNILAGIAPFAIERGLIAAGDPSTVVRIKMVNSGGIAVATVRTPAGVVRYDGDTTLSGVPGTASPILIEFLGTTGSSCGALLPTGQVRDEIDGLSVTCVDNGMPVAMLLATELGVTGQERPVELEADTALRERVERARLEAGRRMNLGDVTDLSVPKMAILSPPAAGGTLCTRTFIPHRCHTSIGVFAGVSIASAVAMAGSVAHDVSAAVAPGEPVRLENPSGTFEIALVDDGSGRGAVVSTARRLFDGFTWPGPPR